MQVQELEPSLANLYPATRVTAAKFQTYSQTLSPSSLLANLMRKIKDFMYMPTKFRHSLLCNIIMDITGCYRNWCQKWDTAKGKRILKYVAFTLEQTVDGEETVMKVAKMAPNIICSDGEWRHPTLCNPINCSMPGSPVHRILQARILERVAIPFSRGPS